VHYVLKWNGFHRCGLLKVTMSQALVMIVDNDAFERMGASYMFSDAGYRVIEAVNADEALQLFEINSDVRLLFYGRNHVWLDERGRLGRSGRAAMA